MAPAGKELRAPVSGRLILDLGNFYGNSDAEVWRDKAGLKSVENHSATAQFERHRNCVLNPYLVTQTFCVGDRDGSFAEPQKEDRIMMLTLSFRVLLLAVLFLILSTAVPAQSTATLQGTVTDQKGAVVPNATVIVRSQATSIERNVQTDSYGNYQVAALPAGVYAVEVQAQGFK